MISEEIKNGGKDYRGILLEDMTTGEHIKWNTDSYDGISPSDEIVYPDITKIIPRHAKAKAEQKDRAKKKAEVFTPSWVCNLMNNLVDNAWFGVDNVFNTPIDDEHSWQSTKDKVQFPQGKTWQDYVKENRLEITCGEAPFITSRYDTVTGEYIQFEDRVGMLDRKLRIVVENCTTDSDRVEWAIKALKSIYGYEYQGDNLWLARLNVFYTFTDFTTLYVDREITPDEYEEVVNIIAWNIFQMDGLTMNLPNSDVPVQIMDWEENKSILFRSLLKEENTDNKKAKPVDLF